MMGVRRGISADAVAVIVAMPDVNDTTCAMATRWIWKPGAGADVRCILCGLSRHSHMLPEHFPIILLIVPRVGVASCCDMQASSKTGN